SSISDAAGTTRAASMPRWPPMIFTTLVAISCTLSASQAGATDAPAAIARRQPVNRRAANPRRAAAIRAVAGHVAVGTGAVWPTLAQIIAAAWVKPAALDQAGRSSRRVS